MLSQFKKFLSFEQLQNIKFSSVPDNAQKVILVDFVSFNVIHKSQLH